MISWLKTNIFNITSVIAFIMSSMTWVVTVLSKRRKLKVSVLAYMQDKDGLLTCLSISNLSQLPISVSKIHILIENVAFPCVLMETYVGSESQTVTSNNQKRLKFENNFFTAKLPVAIPTLGGAQCYFDFPNAQLNSTVPPTDLTFLIFSNRGKEFRIVAPLEYMESV